MRIKIKPLSINEAFQGKRFKTAKCKDYEEELWWQLPKMSIPKGKLKIKYIFGFSNKNADLCNPEKILTDVLSKKYGFNDKMIYEMTMLREDVKKGEEFIDFEIKIK